MKTIISKILLSIFIVFFLVSCSLLEDIGLSSKKINDEWTVEEWGGGGDNPISPRNHFYTFEVKGTKKLIVLTFNTAVDIKPYVYNSLGDRISDLYYRVDKGTGTLQLEELNEGQYSIVICTQKRNDFGKYSIEFSGISGTPQKTRFEKLETTNKEFGIEGGAGREYSFKNHVYTFDVTSDKSSIDGELQSADADLYFEIYNPLGQILFRDIYYSGRKIFAIEETNKGKYSMLVASKERDLKGKYNFKISGNVSNLKQIETQSKIFDDVWQRGTSHTYTITITEDQTPLDITLKSPDNNCSFEVLNPVGTILKYNNIYNGRYESHIETVNKGVHKIVVKPLGNANNQPTTMKYTLSVYGKFSDFKKL